MATTLKETGPEVSNHLKQTLANHSYVIEINGNSFLPYQAVLDRVGHIPLEIQLGKTEWQSQMMIPGHRLVPFISPDLEESELTEEGNMQKMHIANSDKPVDFYSLDAIIPVGFSRGEGESETTIRNFRIVWQEGRVE